MQTGMGSVKGRVIVDGSALPMTPQIDEEQPPHVAYNPAVNGLNLNYNRVYFGWEKDANDYRIDMEARALRYHPAVKMARMAAPAWCYVNIPLTAASSSAIRAKGFWQQSENS